MSTTTEFFVKILETDNKGNSKSVEFGLVEFMKNLYESAIKPRKVNYDCTAGHRDMIEVVTNDIDVKIDLPQPEQGETITVYIVKSDNGKGNVIVSGSIEGKDFDTLTSQNDKQKYISVNGSEFKKW
jgi:hypothetical protein